MQVAAIQMRISDANPEANRRALAQLLDQADGVDVCVVPELWTCGYVNSDWGEMAHRDTPATLDWMAAEAKRRRVWLGGSVIVAAPDNTLANRFVMFGRGGDLVAWYDKAHLFPPLREDECLKAGACTPEVFDLEGVRASMAVCYDLRFPEMFRRLAARQVELVLVASEWPHPRERALKVLAEARAIENQCYVVLANRVGVDTQKREFCGQSAVFGPLGPLAEAGDSVGVVSARLDIDELRGLRARFPVLQHRRAGVDFD